MAECSGLHRERCARASGARVGSSAVRPGAFAGWWSVNEGRDGLSCWLEPRPCRHDSVCSNPTCHGSLGVKGPARPLAAGGTPVRNRGTQRMSPCGTSVEDSPTPHRLLCNPRGLVRGHTARCPRLGHALLLTVSRRARPPAGKGRCPLHSPPGCPWTRWASIGRPPFSECTRAAVPAVPEVAADDSTWWPAGRRYSPRTRSFRR